MEDGTQSFFEDDEQLDSLATRLVEQRIDLYVGGFLDPVSDFPFFEQAILSAQAEVVATQNGKIIGIRLKGRSRRTAWIGGINAWPSLPMDSSSLNRLVDLYTHCQAGVHPTPGALGQAIWRNEWQKAKNSRVSRPPAGCRIDLMAHGTGGRSDQIKVAEAFEVIWEQDMNGAYAWAACLIPWGSAIYFTGSSESPHGPNASTWFCRCTVIVETPLILGPFPVRGSDGIVTYPTHAQTFKNVWLWKEEADAAIQAGADVYAEEGWAWPALSDANQPWAYRMDHLRATAPDATTALLVKAATVAAIGRHGVHPTKYSLVSTPEGIDDIPLAGKLGGLTGYYLHPREESNRPNLTHWFYYIMMRARIGLYQRAVEEINDGNMVVATNYDAIYTLHRSVRNLNSGLGGWKTRILHNASFPYPRALISQEKLRMPGMARKPQ